MLDLALENIVHLENEQSQIHNIKLIKTMGRHKITPTHLKTLFNILQDGHVKGNTAFHWRILEALKGMIIDESGPRNTFVLEGSKSGIVIPDISRWPAPKAFSFCLWFKVEMPTELDADSKIKRMSSVYTATNVRAQSVKLSGVKAPLKREPQLVSIRCLDESGIDLFLKPMKSMPGKFEVELRNYTEREGRNANSSKENYFNSGLTTSPLIVEDGKWHFLAVSLTGDGASGTTVFNRKSAASITIDNTTIESEFPMPKLANKVKIVIGDIVKNSDFSKSANKDSQLGEGHDIDKALSIVSELQNQRSTTLGPTSNWTGIDSMFRGQMGAIYFFNIAVTPAQFGSIYSLGYDYFNCFEPWSMPKLFTMGIAKSSESMGSLQTIFHEQYGLMKSVMLAYNPKTYQGNYILNNTPQRNAIEWKSFKSALFKSETEKGSEDSSISSIDGEMHAMRRLATFQSSRQDITKALDSMGGVKALLPIIYLLYQSTNSKPLLEAINDGYQDESCKPLKSIQEQTPNTFSALIDLIGTFLNERAVEKMNILKQMHGFAIVGYLMEEISPQYFTSIGLQNFIDICNNLSDCNDNGAIPLQNSLISEILLNFRLWVYSSYKIQAELFEWVQKFAIENPRRLRSIVTPIRIMGKMYIHYDYSLCEDDCSRELISQGCPQKYIDERRFEKNENCCGTKPQGNDRIKLRRKLFEILKTCLNAELLPEEVTELVGYCTFTSSPVAKIEYLTLIMSLLQNLNVAPIVLLGLSYCDGLRAIMALVNSKDVKVRLYSVLVFCEILHVSSIFQVLPRVPIKSKLYGEKSSKKQDEDSDPYKDFTLWKLGMPSHNLMEICYHFQQVVFTRINEDFQNGADLSLTKFQVSFIAYSLFATTIGKSVHDLCDYISVSADHTDTGSSGGVNIETKFSFDDYVGSKICLTVPLIQLLTFINNDFVNPQEQFDILFQLKLLVQSSEENCDNFIAVYGWQMCLLNLYFSKLKQNKKHENETSDQEALSRSIQDLCIRLLFDLNITSLKIGKTMLPPSFSAQELEREKDTDAQFWQEFSNGDRIMGAVVVRETIIMLRNIVHNEDNKQENSEKAVASQKLMENLFDEVLEEMKLPLDELSVKYEPLQNIAGDESDKFTSKLRHLNVWILSTCFLDSISSYCYVYPYSMETPLTDKMDKDKETDTGNAKKKWLIAQSLLQLQSPNYAVRLNHHTSGSGSGSIGRESSVNVNVNSFSMKNSDVTIKEGERIFAESPYCSRAGGVYWTILRIICNILLNCSIDFTRAQVQPNTHQDTNQDKDDDDITMGVFAALRDLMTHCDTCGFEFMKFEQYVDQAAIRQLSCTLV